MVAERTSTSLVSRLTIPDARKIPQGYFRSKLFITSSSNNPLIAAASPLLSFLERLGMSPHLPAIETIRDNIEHELLAFRSRLSSQRYANEFIVIAHYLLCSTIDELLGKNYLRVDQQPAEFKAFTPSSHDNLGPERRFFSIIEYIKERAHQYLDLLELGYYCLISGFEGEYHCRADGRQALDNLIEELHQLIQQHRVHKTPRLFRETPPETVDSPDYKMFTYISLLALGVLTLLFFGSQALIEHKAKALFNSNAIFSEMDD